MPRSSSFVSRLLVVSRARLLPNLRLSRHLVGSVKGRAIESVRTSVYLNNRIEEDHRGIKCQYQSMCGFKASAARYCRGFEELRPSFYTSTL
jgi:transposase-like protein